MVKRVSRTRVGAEVCLGGPRTRDKAVRRKQVVGGLDEVHGDFCKQRGQGALAYQTFNEGPTGRAVACGDRSAVDGSVERWQVFAHSRKESRAAHLSSLG